MKNLFAIFAVLVLVAILFSCHPEQVEGNPFIDEGGQEHLVVYSSSSSLSSNSGLRLSSSLGASSSRVSSSSFLRSSSSNFQPQSSSSVTMCNNTQYNPLEQGCCVYTVFNLASQRCQGNIVETKCGVNWYDAIIQRCENNIVETQCGNGWFNAANTNLRCQSNIVETRCGVLWYNAANASLRCQNNVVETQCGTEWVAASAALDCQSLCGANKYDPANQRCGANNVIETLCGSGWYNAANSNLRCQSNTVETRCGNEWYNADNSNLRCQSNVVETKCGAGWYDAANANLRCQSNVVQTKCGTTGWYDATYQRCQNNVVETSCGTAGWYNSVNQRCGTNNVVETQCGTSWYNAANADLRCQSNVVEIRCGTNWYSGSCPSLTCAALPQTTGTAGTSITTPTVSCGTATVTSGITWTGAPSWTNPTEGTFNNVRATATCGGSSQTASCSGTLTVNAAPTLACAALPVTTGTAGTAITNLPTVSCGGTAVTSGITWRNNTTAFSWSSPVAGTYSNINANATCGGSSQTASCSGTLTVTSSSSSGGKGNNIANYRTVTIGSQTWMAENLDYAVEGSICYINQNSYCTIYGRLYNWVTAMALPASCQTTLCASQINAKHRGICPAGWHIPNSSDWDILMNYVQTDNGSTYTSGSHASIAGRYLKATNGWNAYSGIVNEDKYGFAALPGGIVFSDGFVGGDYRIGYWWSSIEGGSGNAYRRRMNYNYDVASWDGSDKNDLLSVRRVQD